MKVRFGDTVYEKNKRNGRALKSLCWDIFKHYLNRNESLSYQDIQKIFNEWHCNNNFVVLNESEWNEKTDNLKSRYFEPVKYNDLNLYFTTQWGNNGADCDNIISMLNFAKELNYDIEILEGLDENTLIVDKYPALKIKNIILYGSPGVGKTHNTNKLINLLESGKNVKEIFKEIKENKKETIELDEDVKSRTKFVTFHQSFGYEDFIEGFRPNEEGKIELVDGIFKNICKEAEDNISINGGFSGLHQPSLDDSLVKKHDVKSEKIERKNYYLVIDEINRGNISKIFGELITLIEEDKRDKLEVTLPYSKQPFKIPSNLYIIGTMNSSDKSIALIDIALRRRFTFLKMEPNAGLIENSEAKALFIKLNAHIKQSHLGEDYQIGHSYFMGIESSDDLDFVWEYKIKPLLEEYFYGDDDGLDEVLCFYRS